MKDRIRQLMEARGMTQKTFANLVGINEGSLSGVFNNRTRPTLNMVESIKSKITNLNVNWLLFGQGSMYETGEDVTGGGAAEEQRRPNRPSTDIDVGLPDLFANNQESERRPASNYHHGEMLRPEIRVVEKPRRQITEIRVYFDDLTYETFVPKK